MTKSELVAAVSQKAGLENVVVQAAVESFFEVVKTNLVQGKHIEVRGFGSFLNKKRNERMARDIKKNTTVLVKAHYYPAFKPSKIFVQKLNLDPNIKTQEV